jgi:2-polyprenyl-3-methyl-5-hydroxy-6-metoxy-1,4-benzoquinol methylase
LPSMEAAGAALQGETADDIYAKAISHYRGGEFVQAENLCRLAVTRNPRHVRSLVLLGDVVQRTGRNKLAVRLLSEALELDCADAVAHDTIAIAYQALGRQPEAVQHFAKAIALGLRDVETLVARSDAVAAASKRLADAWPRQLPLAELLGREGAAPFAADAMLLALLQSRVIHDLELERLFTAVRRGLLEQAANSVSDVLEPSSIEFYCALAQQCFLNEYVFAHGDLEGEQLQRLHGRIVEALRSEAEVSPLDLIVIACYVPLHGLPMAPSLLNVKWPDAIDAVLTQQIREPLEELADRPRIPALTTIDDATSLQVQSQYEESPYPRWTTVPPINPTTVVKYLREDMGVSLVAWPITTAGVNILVAGCGTGFHSIDSALRFPRARILAIDVSRSSLAYARRKSRGLGLTNIEHAQADILKLGSLERRFDVIEAVGVLHHLSDPEAGWRHLISLLHPNGLMFVGLYSALARRSLASARTLIDERGYRATAEDIRCFRQDLIGRGGMPPFADFSSTSGCRDLLFHVMEHQFTIPQIRKFLDAHQLTFLGFSQLQHDVYKQFRQLFPAAGAAGDLASWEAFEQTHPLTFRGMYKFWVQKTKAAAG